MGGIGMAISPVNPDIIYAIIEAANRCKWILPQHRPGRFLAEDERPCRPRDNITMKFTAIPKDADKVYSR